jgi:sphingomyelin phosphodiesterase
MLHKPDFLRKDNFLDFLYREIKADTQERKTISVI